MRCSCEPLLQLQPYSAVGDGGSLYSRKGGWCQQVKPAADCKGPRPSFCSNHQRAGPTTLQHCCCIKDTHLAGTAHDGPVSCARLCHLWPLVALLHGCCQAAGGSRQLLLLISSCWVVSC